MPHQTHNRAFYLEGFRKFPVDPYYEPLSWFMILVIFTELFVKIEVELNIQDACMKQRHKTIWSDQTVKIIL